MIDISGDLIDDVDPDSFSFHWSDEAKISGTMFINFEGRLIPVDENLPEGCL